MKRFDIKSRLLKYLSRGLCPKQLALMISLSFVLGIFPLYGVTTLLMLLVSNRLRLNAALMISTGYLFTPLLFVFWIPFIKIGLWMTFQDNQNLSLEGLKSVMDSGGFQVVTEFSELIVLGIIGWLWIVPIVLGVTYFPLLFLLKRLQTRQNQSNWKQISNPC